MNGPPTATSDALRAVLREADQRDGRTPHVCVVTGQKTERAIQARAADLGSSTEMWERAIGNRGAVALARLRRRPVASLVLPVSEGAWKQWRVRLGRVVAVNAFALGVLAIGVARLETGYLLLAVVVAALGQRIRVRAWRDCWVGLAFRSAAGDIVVSRVHPTFADEAKRLYVGSIRRGLQER